MSVLALSWLIWAGCQGEPAEVGPSISAYRERLLAQDGGAGARGVAGDDKAAPVAWQSELEQKAALMTQPAATTQPIPAEVLAAVPDPAVAVEVFRDRLEALRAGPRTEQHVIDNYQRVVERTTLYLEAIGKPRQFELGLAECIQRALRNNYAIRVDAYNPAISQTQVVEAEAAFDAEFFLDGSFDKRDQATVSPFAPGTGDTRALQGGFRKLLPTGMQVSTALAGQRSENNLPAQYQTLNPAYSNNFVVAFTQPLLRNFGLEVNRAQINIQRAGQHIAQEKFQQTVRDTLLEVEAAYWQLAQARRTAAVLAESVAQNHVTYRRILDRERHDATQVELSNAESRWRTREVEYQESVKNIRDAEDRLKNLLNDPELRLSDDIEIIPTDTPLVAGMALDHLAAVRTALDKRNELNEARYRIEQARISTGVAKNQTLPQLDLTFEYEVQGLGDSADSSFDNLTTNRFISYTVRATFSYPFGNRAREAAYRRARLQESQAIVGLHRVTDGVVEEVNTAVRVIQVRYAQIPPQLEAVRAAERNLQALQARTQRIDPLYLDQELGAVERLGDARNRLIQVVTSYNLAIIGLEKAKGTLLDYNNIVVIDEPRGR